MPTPSLRNRETANRHTVRGFTLLELVVVAAILTLLSAVTIASLTPSQSLRQQAAARLLASKINAHRWLALSTGTPTWVSFNVSTNSCSFHTDSPSAPGWANATQLVDPDTGRPSDFTIAAGEWAGVAFNSVTIPGGGSVLGFDWKGRSTDSGGSTLTLSTVVSLSGSVTVTIQPGSGLATVP